MTATRDQEQTGTPAAPSLVALLGEQRAELVAELRRREHATVAELATHLGISEVATRRHLGVLVDDGLVTTRTVARGRGRPAAHYLLTDTASALFPQRYDALAVEMLAFLTDAHGRDGLRAFLRWRMQREVDALRDAVTAEDLHGRVAQLASALTDAGFDASVAPDGEGFALRQQHCTIEGVAREHPEVCAYEAASFSTVLGRDVVLSRRETLAEGGHACVCHIRARRSASPDLSTTTTTADPSGTTATNPVPSSPSSPPQQGAHQ